MIDQQHGSTPVFHDSLQILESHRGELVAGLTECLRKSIFESRAFVRPSDVVRIAVRQADEFFDFLANQDMTSAADFGRRLGDLGVGEGAVLTYSTILVRFLGKFLDLETAEPFVNIAEDFYRTVIKGYFSAREHIILKEQERIRWALQQSLHRYTIQLETAAEVARVAIGTLNLPPLLTAVVDLVCSRLDLDFVAAYLVDDNDEYLVLSESSCGDVERDGEPDIRLRIDGSSTAAQCLVSKHNMITSIRDLTSTGHETSWFGNAGSEMCLPLITHGKAIGVLSAQSIRSDKFSSQDVTGFQIMADQLANAIENARLYADVRQRADDLAAAYEQLKELELLKDQFMQNISHELRTPLTMIRGYAELLNASQLGALNTDQLEAIDVILRYSNSLTILVDDIMAIMEVNTSRISNKSVSLAQLIHTSLLDFQVLAAGAGVVLVSDIDENDPRPIVFANPDHIRRIIENLIGNAVKFTPAGGKVQVNLETQDDLAIIQVSDTGIGIPSEMVSHVFDRFFQVDGSRRRRHGGAGLGLALVKELVESYGGWVAAESEGIDRGATFRVALPTV